ncbi:hypothetical protein QTL97_04860 [Sporosarcina thermotolerans]|uniref:Uncharacterized protein n=1 Tax=Sporosarcina thermotolerans TaxID=633404 RepID=A0AAW9AAV1_9BACL|nr:hypothetical protein [Sporosarcina thermotolerans]MDW0116253.1 hypothetical protein [Sporosarcina thermotolerans]WHT48226.1 hypothetical protein QNH10_19775 [Sporosarcina thermotolerans]
MNSELFQNLVPFLVQKAQYKGKTELTYTLQNRPKREKTAISFKGHEIEEGFEISVVTITLENVKKDLMQPLFPDDLREQMLKIAKSKQNNND